MTYTEKELDQFLHGISLSLLSKKSAQHWRYDEETAKEIEWLEALERKVRADKADRKTENSSEKPNNCDTCGTPRHLCEYCIEEDRMWTPKDEPTISKMEQVDKDINVRSKDEPQTDCLTCRYNSDEWDSPKCDGCSKADSHYEPQTDCAWR
jgi:hypothetical protein